MIAVYIDNIEKGINYAIIFFISSLLIASTFSKAGVEVFSFIAILLWLTKKILFSVFKASPKLIPFPQTPLNYPVLSYVLIVFLSVFNSVNFRSSVISFVGKTIEYVLLYFIVCDTVKTKRSLYIIFSAVALALIGLIIDSVFQYFSGFSLFRHYPMNDDLRLKASFTNATGFASWLILTIPLFSALAIFKTEKKYFTFRTLSLILSLLSLVCLYFTYSKAALLGLAVSFVFILAYCLKRKNRLFVWLLLILSLAGFIFLKRSYILDLINSNYPPSLLMRLDLWKMSLSMLADYPILGSGPSTYVDTIQFYGHGWQSNTSYPHNSFLHLACETGLAGLACFIWIIYDFFRVVNSSLKSGSQVKVELAGLSAGIAAFLTQSFFDTSLFSLQLIIPFWIFLGLSIILSK